MSNIFNIQDDKVIIDTVALRAVEGQIIFEGSLLINGPFVVNNKSTFNTSPVINGDLAINGAIVQPLDIKDVVTMHSDLVVDATITAKTLRVGTLITDSGPVADYGNWIESSESDLAGKGLHWSWGDGNNTQLIYRDGNRIWTSSNIDLKSGSSFCIDNTPLLSENTLGSTITKSNLRQVGVLNTLTVLGEVSFGDSITCNSNNGRIGIGTKNPTAKLSIVENAVEVNIGVLGAAGTIGTRTNHDIAFISDNRPRMIIKQSGDVTIGNEYSTNGILRVFGTIHADKIVTATNEPLVSSLKFNSNSIGLMWDNAQSLIMANGVLTSSQSFAVANNASYFIGGTEVLSGDTLGQNILHSNLTSVGTLTSLTVAGTSEFDNLTIRRATAGSIHIDNSVRIADARIDFNFGVVLSHKSNVMFHADDEGVTINASALTDMPIKLNGKVSIGVNTPDPTLALAVNGDVSLCGKRFTSGTASPISGTCTIGDICWNTAPTPDGYVGWICMSSGNPGVWMPFGAIGRM